MPMQHGQKQCQAIRFKADRNASRIHALRFIGKRLHFNEHRPAAFARDHHRAARHRSGVVRQKDRRRIFHLLQSLLGHREHADFIRRAKTILYGADQTEATACVTFEIQHGVDHVLEDARPCDDAFLGDVTDDQHRHARCFRESHQRGRCLADLRRRSGR